MNIFIVAVCVNLLTLITAVRNINFDTILKILKQKLRKSDYSNIDENNEPIEAIPIIPGFYLQKPKDLSKSLFENPKAWPDDLVDILNNADTKTRHNKTRIIAKAVNKGPRNDYLKGKIFKNINKYGDSQKNNNDKITKTKAYMECDDDLIYKKDLLKESKAYVAQKEPVKKLLGRIFQGINGGIVYRGKGKYKKPRNSSKNENKFAKLLKNVINGNINNKKYRGDDKYDYRYDVTEEQSKKTGDLLGSIVNAIQSNDQGQGSEIHQRPAMLIISSASLHNNVYEDENNAKESMEVFDEDYDGSDSHNLYHTRRSIKSKSKSGSSSDEPSDTTVSDSSDYEKNPGNPFTVHKNKYKQNWPYNHYMDGDHMNINPLGPQFGSLGPTGPQLFFGRKWWYFNQDDYKPMR